VTRVEAALDAHLLPVRKSFYPEDWGFLASLRFEGELFVSLGALAKQLRDVALAGEGTCDESRGHIK